MHHNINLADVPVIDVSKFDFVIRVLIETGQGLALLRGLTDAEIRSIEDRIWREFPTCSKTRLAVALRFRALLDAFTGRRLKSLFLERGYRLLQAVSQQASKQPLNIRFGFNAHRLLLALDATTAHPIPEAEAAVALPLAA